MAAGTAALGSVGPVILVGASEAPPCLRFDLSPATRVPLALHVLLRMVATTTCCYMICFCLAST